MNTFLGLRKRRSSAPAVEQRLVDTSEDVASIAPVPHDDKEFSSLLLRVLAGGNAGQVWDYAKNPMTLLHVGQQACSYGKITARTTFIHDLVLDSSTFTFEIPTNYYDVLKGVQLAITNPLQKPMHKLLHKVTVKVSDGKSVEVDNWFGDEIDISHAWFKKTVDWVRNTTIVPLTLAPFGHILFPVLMTNKTIVVTVTVAFDAEVEIWGTKYLLHTKARKFGLTVDSFRWPIYFHRLNDVEFDDQHQVSLSCLHNEPPVVHLCLIGLDPLHISSVSIHLNGCTETWSVAQLELEQKVRGCEHIKNIMLFFDEKDTLVYRPMSINLGRIDSAMLSIATTETVETVRIMSLHVKAF